MDHSSKPIQDVQSPGPPSPGPPSTPPISGFRLFILEPQPDPPPTTLPELTLQPSPSLPLPPSSLLPPLLTALTGTPTPDEVSGRSLAGYTSHPPLRIRNKYVDVQVPLWCDQIPTSSTESREDPLKDAVEAGEAPTPSTPNDPATPASWLAQMQSPLAAEVRAVIGGILVVLPSPTPSPFLPPSLSGPQSTTPPPLPAPHAALLSTVHALRTSIESSRSDALDSDVPSILVLQAPPIASAATARDAAPSHTRASTSTAARHDPGSSSPSAQTADDALIEAVEGYLFDELGLLGWDVVLWHPPPHAASQQLPPYEPLARSEESVERNIHGELTGLARVREVLAGVDWEAVPAVTSDGEENERQNGEEEGEVDGDDVGEEGLRREGERALLGPDADEDEDEMAEAQEEQVERLTALMGRAMAIREMGGSKAERERALRGLMKDI